MERQGAYVLKDEERDRVRDTLFPEGRFDTTLVGKDASAIAAKAGVRVPGRTRILVAPFDLAMAEEPLAHEKLCPVLGVVRVPNARRGIRAAVAILRIGGAGHSAVIHSNDPRTVMDYAAAVRVLRITVNEGGSTGSAGFGTHLAPSMTIGTGFVGRSSLGENLEPKHLVNLTRVAYSVDPSEVLPAYDGMVPYQSPLEAVPPYPIASNLSSQGLLTAVPTDAVALKGGTSELREELRRLIIEELNTIIRG